MTNELETVRVFVGTDATQVVAHQVLAYSLRKHTQREVAVYPMRDLPLPTETVGEGLRWVVASGRAEGLLGA